MHYPHLALVKQHFTTHHLQCVETAVEEELAALRPAKRIKSGQTVAITAGSRGIANIIPILQTVVRKMQSLGAEPFIIPAMGSHGGATAEGQTKLLAGYGITAETVGAPIRSDMEVVELAQSALGLPVYIDRTAASADHIVVINRVKPHTDFEASVESGMVKMMTIGLGKQKGAEQYHNAVLEHGYYPTLMEHARVILDKAPVSIGLGIVENQLDQTRSITACWSEDMIETDMALLRTAKELLPRLPFAEIDLLVVDEMGKDISGTCMDQNVIGRTVIRIGTVPETPAIRRIFVRDLTAKSQGMATGIGNADFTTARLVAKMDRSATYINCLSACEPEMAAIPPYYETDREILDKALATIGNIASTDAKIVHIRNTLDLTHMFVSTALLAQTRLNNALEIITEAVPIRFTADGNIEAPWPKDTTF